MKLFPFNFSNVHKFIIGIITATILLTSSIALSFYTSSRLNNNFGWVEHTYRVKEKLNHTIIKLTECESGVRGYFITQNPTFIKEYKSSIDLIYKNINTLTELTSDNNPQQTKILKLKELIEARVLLFEQVFQIKHDQADTYSKIVDQASHAKMSMDKIRELKNEVENEEDRLLLIRQNLAQQNLTASYLTCLISGFIALCIIALMIIFIRNDIKARVAQENLLTELNDNKNKFFSILSHDLRGPIHGINKLASFMEDEQNTSKEEAFVMAKMIKKTAAQVANLLENLLTWTRLQMGKIDYSPSSFDIKDILVQTIQLLEGNAESKSILLSYQLNSASIYADKNMIETVIRNLMQNAIKFTEQGGAIEIKTYISTDNKFTVSIKDNGIGISKEALKNLFTLQHKNASKGTDNEKGTGLGLILCKEFAEKNAGTMWIESEVGQGTTSYFTLPIVT
jgi:signal transduction histidine kinase